MRTQTEIGPKRTVGIRVDALRIIDAQTARVRTIHWNGRALIDIYEITQTRVFPARTVIRV